MYDAILRIVKLMRVKLPEIYYIFFFCVESRHCLFLFFFLGDDTQVSLINGNLEGSFSEKSTSAAGLESE